MSGTQPQVAWPQQASSYNPYPSPQQPQPSAPGAMQQSQQWQTQPAPSFSQPPGQSQQPYYSQPQGQGPYAPPTGAAPQAHPAYAQSAYSSAYPPHQTQQYPAQGQQPYPQSNQPPQQMQQQYMYGQPYGNSYHQQQQQAQPQTQQTQSQPQQQQQPATGGDYYRNPSSRPQAAKSWVGTVTSIILPNYGIVDGDSFYVNAVVSGQLPQVGQRVRCEAIPNTDGGQYSWRCTRVELDTGEKPPEITDAVAGSTGIGTASTAPRNSSRGSTVIRSNGPIARACSSGPGSNAGGGSEKAKYNSAPPPVVMYTADVAMAVAANAVEGSGSAATVIAEASSTLKAAPFAKPTPELTDEERRRAESAAQQLAQYGDPSGVGAKLLAKMGFGAAEGSKGGLGRNEQGIAAPVDPVGVRGNMGLGFSAHHQQQQQAAQQVAAQAAAALVQQLAAAHAQWPQARADRGSRRGWGRARGADSERDRDRDKDRNWDKDRDRDRNREKERSRRGRSRSGSRTSSSESQSRSRSRSRSRSSTSSGSSSDSGRSRSRSASPRRGSGAVTAAGGVTAAPGGGATAALASAGGSGSSLLGRYAVRPPKFHTWERSRGVASVSKRYRRMYIPSDFCRLEATWLETLPEHTPFPLTHPIDFVFTTSAAAGAASRTPASAAAAAVAVAAPPAADGRDTAAADMDVGLQAAPLVTMDSATGCVTTAVAPVAPPTQREAMSAADVASGRRWSVRVMLLSGVPERALYADDPQLYQHPLRKMRLVVQKRHHHHHQGGSRGGGGARGGGSSSSEVGGIGGCWEPEDGGHPARDPGALVATAIRTFRKATGVDLSSCTQWVHFAEVVYLRSAPSDATVSAAGSGTRSAPGLVEERVVMLMPVDAVAAAQPNPGAVEVIAKAQDAVFGEARARTAAEAVEVAGRAAAAKAAEATRRAVAAGGEDSILDPTTLTVVQLQEELAKRGLTDAAVKKWNPLHGKKPLVDKLQEYLDRRRAEVAASDTEEGLLARAAVEARGIAEAAAARVREAREALAVAQREAREARKVLAYPPVVETLTFAQAGRGAGGAAARITLTSYTLEQLLDYGEDDTREAAFEVSVFVELFREMLQQRYGRALLRALSTLLSPHTTAPLVDNADAPGRDGAKVVAATVPAASSPPKRHATPVPNHAAAIVANAPVGNGARGGNGDGDGAAPKGTQDAVMVYLDAAEEAEQTGDAAAEIATASLAPSHEVVADDAGAPPNTGAKAEGTGPDGKRRKLSDAGAGEAAAAEAAVHSESFPKAKRVRREVQTEGTGSDGSAGAPPAGAEPPAATTTTTTSADTSVAVSEPFLAVCRMFDERCAGYIQSDDLEEITYMTADGVSRRRVQAVVDQAAGRRGRFSYVDHASLVVPPPASAASSGGGSGAAATTGAGPGLAAATAAGCWNVASVNGSPVKCCLVDVVKLQANLVASEADKRSLSINLKRLELQAAESRRHEAALAERVAALGNEVAALQARLNLSTAGRASVDSAFNAVLVEVRAAQARLAAAAAQLEEYGFGAAGSGSGGETAAAAGLAVQSEGP